MRKGTKWLCLAVLWATGAAGQVAVIAHKDVPLDTLSRAQLLDFYSCEVRHWSKELAVTVVDLKPQTEAKAAFYKFLGITVSRMKSLWLKKMLMGEGEPPVALKSEAEVLKAIATTPGALGFVSLDSSHQQVKTLIRIANEEH